MTNKGVVGHNCGLVPPQRPQEVWVQSCFACWVKVQGVVLMRGFGGGSVRTGWA